MKKLVAVLSISAFGIGAAVAQEDLSGGGATASKGLTENESAVQNDKSNRKSGNVSSAGAGAPGSPASSGIGASKAETDTAGSAGSSAETIRGTSGASNSGGNRGSTDGGGAGVTTGISGAGIPGNLGTMDGTKGNNSPYIGSGATTSEGSSGNAGPDQPTTGTGIPSAATGGSEKHLFRGQSPEPRKSDSKSDK